MAEGREGSSSHQNSPRENRSSRAEHKQLHQGNVFSTKSSNNPQIQMTSYTVNSLQNSQEQFDQNCTGTNRSRNTCTKAQDKMSQNLECVANENANQSPRIHTYPPNQLPRSPSPRYRLHSDPSSPARSPSPQGSHISGLESNVTSDSNCRRKLSIGEGSGTGGADSSISGVSVGEVSDNKIERKPKSVSFHSHTNWKSDRKTESGKYF